MNDIPISKNHFYKRKPISVDVELNATYRDDYSGGSKTTITISNDVEDTLYLFDTEVPSVDKDFKKLDEMHLELYVNTTSSSTSINPSFYVYPVKNIYNITEGTSTPLDKGLSVFSSVLDPNKPLMIETFDGSNKGFGRDEEGFENSRRVRKVTGEKLFITWRNVKKIYNDNNFNIEESYFIDDKVLEIVESEGQYGAFTFEGYAIAGAGYWGQVVRYTKEGWLDRGAYQSFDIEELTGSGKQVFDKIIGSETYTNAITPYNSIFNIVHKEPNVYDIKVQTLEDVGADQYTFTMNNFDITTDDFLEGDSAARMHLFWENYSGSQTGAEAQSFANCYGTVSDTPEMQTMFATITDIPIPRKLDLLTDASGSTCMPEIEIVFKVKSLPTVLRGFVTTDYTLGRSINFILANKPPSNTEQLFDYTKRLFDTRSSGGGSSPADSNFLHVTGISAGASVSGSFRMVAMDGNTGNRGYNSNTGLPLMGNYPTAINYGVDLPMNEWIRMRIRQYDNDKSALLYFPDLPTRSTGSVQNIIIDDTDVDGKFGGLNCLTIAISNFRGVATGSNASGHINHDLGADLDGGENDRDVELIVDSISFHGYNHSVTNVTQGKLKSNETRVPLQIKSDVSVVTNPTSEWSFATGADGRASKNTSDSFYTLAKTPSPTIVSFGFDNKTGLANKFLQFNNYRTALGAASGEIDDEFIEWGYSDESVSAGGVTTGCLNLAQDTDIVTDGALAVDNFSKKGYLKISGSTAINNAIGGTGGKDWVKTVNPWVSALVLEISNDGKTIVVDNPEIFDEPVGLPTAGGQAYVAFSQNGSTTQSDAGIFNTYAKMNAGSGSVGQKADDLYQVKPREGNKIFLNRSINKDDKQALDLGTTSFTTQHSGISRLLISPKKFWLWGMFQNVSPQSTSTRKWGEWFDNPSYSGSLLSPKNYDSVRLFSTQGSVGSTYNEFLYNDGSNQNQWKLSYINTDNILEMNKDYGYGAYKEASGEEPAQIGGYICKEMVLDGASTKYFNLSSYADKNKLFESNKLKFAVYPEFDNAYYYNINIDSAEGTNPPAVIYGYNKPLPTIDNLTASPRFDFLKENVNVDLFGKANGTDIVFNWQESKDVEYRVLFVDTKYIRNKYHGASFIAPLNDSSTPAKMYFADSTNVDNAGDKYIAGSSVDLTGTNLPNIEGAQGYATKLAGTQLKDDNSRSRLGTNTGGWTVMATLKPTAKAGSADLDIALEHVQGGATTSLFALGVDNNSKIQFTVTGSSKLTSTSAFAMDGQEQLNIIVTFDNDLDTDNLKLYVNGKLEDTADYTHATIFNFAGKLYIGGDASNANHYSGFIEEIVIYPTTLYVVPNNREFILPTKVLPDLDSGVSNKYQAKMFAFDNTNIRGFNKTDVAASNSVSWKITGVA
tara:strand:- start:498 stop:4697 length:4200 start_codon:yes stop_codon:yes gene_type:complete